MAQQQSPPVRDNPDRHRFEIELGDGQFAFAEYTLPAGKIMFTHTEVPANHEGRGIGTSLIEAALASARKRGLKVIPICPFFDAYMRRHKEVQDLLEDSWRTRFGLEQVGEAVAELPPGKVQRFEGRDER